MRTHIVPIMLAAIVMGGVSFSGPPPQIQSEAAPIDFASLHNQAMSALQALRTSQEFRITAQDNN